MSARRWAVECDDERWSFKTRREAREYARHINRHPANQDIRRFGPYASVDGVARVVDRW